MKAKSLASNATLIVLFSILVMLLAACVGVVNPTSQPVTDTNQAAPLQITNAGQQPDSVAVLPPAPPICPNQEFVELSILIDPLDSGVVAVGGSDIFTKAGATKVCRSDLIQVTARPRDGNWQFDHWEGDITGTRGATDLKTDSDKSATAVFVRTDQPTPLPGLVSYKLGVNSIPVTGTAVSLDNGLIRVSPPPGAGQQNYLERTQVELVPQPVDGYDFGRWGEACSGSGICLVTMNGDRNVTAYFTSIATPPPPPLPTAMPTSTPAPTATPVPAPTPQPALISEDGSFGADTITLDTATGLRWLDVIFSTPYSYDQIVAQLESEGAFSGYRLATKTELLTLWQDAGIDTEPGFFGQFTNENFLPIVELMSLVSVTAPTTGNLGEGNLFDFTAGHIASGVGGGGPVDVATLSADPDPTMTGRPSIGFVPSTNENNHHGSWLVTTD